MLEYVMFVTHDIIDNEDAWQYKIEILTRCARRERQTTLSLRRPSSSSTEPFG